MSEVGQYSYTAAKKTLFHCFLTKNCFVAVKIENHHTKQVTPSESCDQDNFVSLGFGDHHIDIMRLDLLQCNGVATK